MYCVFNDETVDSRILFLDILIVHWRCQPETSTRATMHGSLTNNTFVGYDRPPRREQHLFLCCTCNFSIQRARDFGNPRPCFSENASCCSSKCFVFAIPSARFVLLKYHCPSTLMFDWTQGRGRKASILKYPLSFHFDARFRRLMTSWGLLSCH